MERCGNCDSEAKRSLGKWMRSCERRGMLAKDLLLTPEGVRRRRLVRGEFVWSLQGGAHAMMLDGWVPRSMRASAPRPLALAGVTRTKSISDPVAITISVLSWCRPKGDKTLLDRCSHNNHIKRCVIPLPALFSVPPWIHHLTGISMHLVFQGFPSCLFPGVP